MTELPIQHSACYGAQSSPSASFELVLELMAGTISCFSCMLTLLAPSCGLHPKIQLPYYSVNANMLPPSLPLFGFSNGACPEVVCPQEGQLKLYLDFLAVVVDSVFNMSGDSLGVSERLGLLVSVDLVSPVGRHVDVECVCRGKKGVGVK